jgi:hypothetical protein
MHPKDGAIKKPIQSSTLTHTPNMTWPDRVLG